ncbi:MAG TPA: multidrug efflux RND transporter permease subunit [Thermoanaerobaculia bacterium]|nr:multidrug efflux RND transporter permease subunit [Thermoanaerobaculia bacterium]
MARFFINRPVVAIVISIVTVLGGLVALFGLPIEQFPDIIPPLIQIQGSYSGADALTIEQSVATPIEQQMNGVENMLYVQSVNAGDGTFSTRVTFDVGTDRNTAQVNAQNRVSQATPSLPTEVSQFGLTYRKTQGSPLMLISLYSPKRTYDPLFIGNYAMINVNDAIYRVPGVGQVLNFGASEYAMRVWVKPDSLAKLGITSADIQRAIQTQNSVNPAGQIGAEPVPAGQEFTYTVRAQGRLVTAEEFGKIVVRLNPDGSAVRLSDVARIELGALSYRQRGRFNGNPSANVAIFQAPGSNALEVAEGVKKTMAELKQRFPEDLDYTISVDTTRPVTAGIAEIRQTLIEAMILVILVVFLFLQNWRATLIPIVAVPVSLIGTFAIFPLLGFSINTLSLFGLVLAIGLVVDDAIVVVEAVEHHIEEGMAPRAATIQAMKEVSGPVVAIALILSSVFLPVAFMGGIQGRLNQQFAVTIAVSVLISAFNALTLSPALSALLLRPRKQSKGVLARFFGGFNRVFDRFTRGYVKVSALLIRKAAIGVALLLGFTLFAGLLGSKLPGSFVPQEDQAYMLINVQLPDASSLQRTDEVAKKVEKILAETRGVQYYNTIVGFSLLSSVSASYSATFFSQLHTWDKRHEEGLSATDIVQKLNGRFRAEIPEATIFAFQPPSIPGLGASGGFSLWLQDRSGGPVEFLDENLQKFLEAARQRPELQNVNSTFRAAVPQVFVDVDRDKALKQGVPVNEVYQTLQTFLGGSFVNQFNRFGRQWRVFVQAEAEDRLTPDAINHFYVRNNDGNMVPLSAVTTVRQTSGPEYIQRFNLYRAAQVTGAAAPGYSSGQAMAALEDVARQVLPREMGYDWSDLSFQEKRAAGTTSRVFVMSLIFVFLILAALYESWSLPFSVLLSVPVAVFGAFLGLQLRKYDFDVYGQIGLVVLIGLAAKNAILIVEFAKAELEKGRDLVSAALEGARLRLRPILMTSFAFILGCVPLWVASGAGAAARRILGTVVVSGMLAATVLAIFLIPALYVVVERIAGSEKRLARKRAEAADDELVAEGAH